MPDSRVSYDTVYRDPPLRTGCTRGGFYVKSLGHSEGPNVNLEGTGSQTSVQQILPAHDRLSGSFIRHWRIPSGTSGVDDPQYIRTAGPPYLLRPVP